MNATNGRETAGKRLRRKLANGGVLLSPCVFDVMSTLIADRAGYDAVCMVGSGAAAAAIADIEEIYDLSRRADLTRRMAFVSDLPIIVDAEDGYGNAVGVAHTIRVLERAGGAAALLDDGRRQPWHGKPGVLSLKAAIDMIKTAVDARSDPGFVIMYRTSVAAFQGVDALVERAESAAEAGADVMMIIQMKLDQLAQVIPRLRLPVMTHDGTGTRTTTVDNYRDAGVRILLYRQIATNPAYTAVESVMNTVRADGHAAGVASRLASIKEMDEFLGIAEVKRMTLDYGLLEPSDNSSG